MPTVVRHADPVGFDRGLRAFFEYRDLGVKGATAGAVGAHVIRAVPGEHPEPRWHQHRLDFQFVVVLRGWVRWVLRIWMRQCQAVLRALKTANWSSWWVARRPILNGRKAYLRTLAVQRMSAHTAAASLPSWPTR